jgi:DNA modification methylase
MKKNAIRRVSTPKLHYKVEDCGILSESFDQSVRQTKKLWRVSDTRVSVATKEVAEYGTFKDSLRAPIHRWFKYPAGFSYKLVDQKLHQYRMGIDNIILDPFVGSGTTCVEAKRLGVNSIGIEAHPFVCWVAKVKVNWDLDLEEIIKTYNRVIDDAKLALREGVVEIGSLPELVRKCYSDKNLSKLIAIRDAIKNQAHSAAIRDFLNLALTDTLRNSSKAATGWPYIAPAEMHEKVSEKEAFLEFRAQVGRMVDDLQFMQLTYGGKKVDCVIIQGDARLPHMEVEKDSIDLALTSPPYLNNYDYADRTRLETYFFGWYSSWGEITDKVRSKLMMSATTQVRRDEFGENGGLSDTIRHADGRLYAELLTKIQELRLRRQDKGGKKSYDCLVAGYFNDMLESLRQVYDALKSGGHFVLVLGDSAPYGVYIPTHEYLARIGLGLGYKSWHVEELRTRGDKWKNNPQRHKVKLKEVILTLSK